MRADGPLRGARGPNSSGKKAAVTGGTGMTLSNLSIRMKLVLATGIMMVAAMGTITIGGITLAYQTAGEEAEARARAMLGEYSQLATGQMGAIISATRSLAAGIEGMVEAGSMDRDQL